MEYTPNLNLKKPAKTDPVLIDDLNDNMDILDQVVSDSRIVEQGSNENGTYWRWENGLQVCLINLPTLDEFTDMGRRGSFTHFRKLSVYYPASFLSAPKTLVDIAGSVDGSVRAVIASIWSSTTSHFRLHLYIDDEITRIDHTSCLAVGRWK